MTPGWIISVLLIVSFSYAAISMLAPWQLNKDEDIVARNEQILEGFEREVVPYSELFDAAGVVPQTSEYFRVSLTGHYLPDSEVLLRLRPVNDGPAFQSLTPFELEDGRVVLINRGFVSSEGTIVPEIAPAPAGETTIVGLARKNERVPGTAPMEDSGYKQVYGINTEQISEVTGLDLGTDYVQLSENQPGVLSAMPIPQLDRGSHLSYGFQWIAFGIMAPLGLGYFVWAEFRERRREKQERAEMAELVETAGQSEPATGLEKPSAAVAEPQQVTVALEEPNAVEIDEDAATKDSARKRRARYGNQHPNHYQQLSKRDEQRF
ncbi:SURF1 family protein [Corynebacterium callunae]